MATALLTRPVPAAPIASGAGWTPRAPRREVFQHARVSGPTIPDFTGRIRNISASGMLLDMVHPLRPGDIVTAIMPGGAERLCRVARTKGQDAGLKFIDKD